MNKFHAQVAGDILRDVGYDDTTIARVGALLKQESLKAEADAQALEDVVALVFLESYLAGFVSAHGEYDPAKFADILAKTAKKMSPRGRAAALTLIALPASSRRLSIAPGTSFRIRPPRQADVAACRFRESADPTRESVFRKNATMRRREAPSGRA